MMKSIAMVLIATSILVGGNKPAIKSKQKQTLEIEDIISEDRRFIQEGEYLLDRWALLPETIIVLPIPTTAPIPEQVKRAAAWEYKFSPDREMFREEYLAVINNPIRWVEFIGNHVDLLNAGAMQEHRAAANRADSEGMKVAKMMWKASLTYGINSTFWKIGIEEFMRTNPRWKPAKSTKQVGLKGILR